MLPEEAQTFPSPSLLLPTPAKQGTYYEESVGPVPVLTQTCHLSKFLFVFPAYMTLSHVTVPQLLLPSPPRTPPPPGHLL